MNIDPFFDASANTLAEKHTLGSKIGLTGLFLCSFDNTHGLQILFSYPPKLQKDQNEINILKTHCIWKIENIPLRVDLKFSEFVYSAFQLQDTSQEEEQTTIDQPIYGIIIKKWKDSDPIPINAFADFKTTLETNIGPDLKLLYKRHELASNPIKKRKYNELSKKAIKIEQYLKETWKDLNQRINEILDPQTINIDIHTTTSMTPIETSYCAHELFKQKITMRVLATDENENRIMIVLINQSEDLKDVQIHVSKSTEFFSELIWEQELDEWPLKEDLILEFFKSDVVENYLIRISSKKTTIDIKSLKVGTSIAS
ncbi:MAG: hypothetical protein JSU57_01260 [Candidatus Heimdallarchaeota archaeon]|nr:MAG: hypothetical protein JSU57_01260 [Candidatus Heimdallarchaeota archaeon]